MATQLLWYSRSWEIPSNLSINRRCLDLNHQPGKTTGCLKDNITLGFSSSCLRSFDSTVSLSLSPRSCSSYTTAPLLSKSEVHTMLCLLDKKRQARPMKFIKAKNQRGNMKRNVFPSFARKKFLSLLRWLASSAWQSWGVKGKLNSYSLKTGRRPVLQAHFLITQCKAQGFENSHRHKALE